MNIINLTPHAVTVVNGGETTTFAPSGAVARCAAVSTPAGSFTAENGVEVALTTVTFGEVVGLPDAASDTIYVVSGLVRSAVPTRRDVASPGDPVRDGAGVVIGCRSLILNS